MNNKNARTDSVLAFLLLLYGSVRLLPVDFHQIGAARLRGRGRGLTGGDDHIFTEPEQRGRSYETFGAGEMAHVVVSDLMREHAP